jgi:hypothetical protein
VGGPEAAVATTLTIAATIAAPTAATIATPAIAIATNSTAAKGTNCIPMHRLFGDKLCKFQG